MRVTVGIVQQKNGVLHSVWVSKERAQKWIDEQPKELVERIGWYAEEMLVRGTES